MIISHIKKDDNNHWEFQSNEEHQAGVAKLASEFADSFGMSEWGKVLGLLHDKGKEQKTFQQHIKSASGYENIHVDGDYNHAYVGALIAKKLFNNPPYYQFIDNIIMGHHRGLYDDGDKAFVLKKDLPSDIAIPQIEAKLNLPPAKRREDINHIIRMLYSCLVDADYLDTEQFMQPEQSKLRGGKSSIEELLTKLESHLNCLKNNAQDTDVNKIRNEVQDYCINQSSGDIDFYSLTVPTGGGKTLSSILWALRHAKTNKQRRIIIAIPYTSIITQTASVLKSIFGCENVLEHHSNVNTSDNIEKELSLKLRLATENWDYPIIVTTNVQLFESLFSNRPSDCRKLHNIANSVIILDEVQTLPMAFLRPIVDVLNTLNSIFNVSVLFTTASQPILSGRINGCNPMVGFDALPHIHEIIPHEANLHDRLRRVKLEINDNPQSYEQIACQIGKHQRVLCIVNTRKDAKEIYTRLPKDGLCFHLSRMMCPEHVKETIQEIKKALKDNSNTVIRVIATQLIEAGVDIDFPVVYRQEAGLDSILQAAGRCNREGKLGICTTYVFALENKLPSGFITQTNNARKNICNDNIDWFSPEAMNKYFYQLHSRIDNFDKANIKDLLYKPEMQFEEASNKFNLIDDSTISVVVNWKCGMDFVHRLKTDGISYNLMRNMSQYSVNIRKRDFDILNKAGAIEEILEGIYAIQSPKFYDNKVGLVTDNKWLEETYII